MEVRDLGLGFELREFYDGGVLVGYTITGPAGPRCRRVGRCGGLAAIRPYEVRHGDFVRVYGVWAVSGEWPSITLSPSVACDCGDQHGFVRDGRYESAGGVVG